MFVCSFPHWEP